MTASALEAQRDQFVRPLAARRALVESGRIDPVRYRRALVDYVRTADPEVRAFADFRPADLDGAGVPHACTVTYKDTIDVAGLPTRLGIRSGYRCYPDRSAEIARRLGMSGLVCIGKAAVTECALGTERPSLNPTYPELSASGSSTGSAVAVAAGFCDVSVGTDSGGSIRWPAVYCGATALRLTSRPRWLAGVHTVSPSLESVGLVVRSAADLGWLWRTYGLGAALGARPVPMPRGLRIGTSAPPGESLHPEIAQMLNRVTAGLAARGHRILRCGLEQAWEERPDAWELLSREAYDGFGHLLERDDLPLAGDTRRAIEAGAATSAWRHADLLAQRQRAATRMSVLFSREVDLLLIPLEAGLPDLAERRYASTVPIAGSGVADLSMTIVPSFAGLPVLALPAGRSAGGAPLGLQVVAPAGGEHLLVQAAELIAGLSDTESAREAS